MNKRMVYIASALEPTSWPRCLLPNGELMPEIALAGRSNVGKSTLINHLAGQKNLAKVSSTPGKTQRLQFFCYDEQYLLVDLPGYGFANAPPSIRAEWSNAIDVYLNHRPSLKLILLLLDIRRAPSRDDQNLVEWARSQPLSLLPILTKTDLISPTECEERRHEILQTLSLTESVSIPHSIHRIWPVILQHLAPRNHETR